MIRKHDIPSTFAVILPVSLGFGLIYLSATGKMAPLAALMVIVGIAVVLPLAAMLARIMDEEALEHEYEGPAGPPPRSGHVLIPIHGDVGARNDADLFRPQ